MICAFDYDRRRATFFRSNLKSDAASSAPPVNPTLAEAVNASSTAPVKFFDAPAAIGSLRYWDGGIAGYNNPVLGAVVEAIAGGIPPEDIQVLSIGTASVRRPVVPEGGADTSGLMQTRQASNPRNDLEELASSIIDDPPDAATFIAYVALRQPVPDSNHPAPTSGWIVRMNPMIQPFVKTQTVHGLPHPDCRSQTLTRSPIWIWTPSNRWTCKEFRIFARCGWRTGYQISRSAPIRRVFTARK